MDQQQSQKPLTNIKLRGQSKKRWADRLLQFHRRHQAALAPATTDRKGIRVVCIADTHNKRPSLPPGDVLIHAGDLTDTGSFDEVQAGLDWLAEQPFQHKVLVAGNHDVLLDDAFLTAHPERRYNDTRTMADLRWGSIVYLEDEEVTLAVTAEEGASLGATVDNATVSTPRKLTIYGSPWTPVYGISAFQYRPDSDTHWSERLSALTSSPDILVTHGPPKFYQDQRDWYRAGCAFLGEQVARLRPRLCVFGHIHAAYGREDVAVDAVRWQHDAVVLGWDGWTGLAWMGVLIVWARLGQLFGKREKATTFVNAAVVGGPQNELRNAAIVVDM